MNNKITEQLKKLVIPNSTIAIHTISGGNKTKINIIEDAASILNSGLNQTSHTNSGLPGNCNIINDINDIYHNIYAEEGPTMITVIISIPEILTDNNQEQWYIGKYPTGATKNDERINSLPINKYIETNKNIPREFIVGLYITSKPKISHQKNSTDYITKFIPNKNYLAILNEIEKIKFFETIKPELIKYGLKKVNEQVEKYNEVNKLLGINTYYLELLEEYQEHSKKLKH